MISIHTKDRERIPLIRLGHYLLVPIQVSLSDRLVEHLRDDIGEQIQKTEVRALIVDAHGIDLMDSFIARSVRDIGLMAQVMGVQTVICGMDPAIAITLVEMGMELRGVSTALNLDTAIAMLDRRLKQAEVRDDELLRKMLAEAAASGTEQSMEPQQGKQPLQESSGAELVLGPLSEGPRGDHVP
jgi:rsbT antagonist protein RsbS